MDTTLVGLFAKGKPLICKRGHCIVYPYVPSNNIYLIKQGYVKAYSLTTGGEEKILCFYTTGDIVPVDVLFGNGIPLYYECMTAVELRIMNKNTLIELITHNKQAVEELLALLSKRMEIYAYRLQQLTYNSPLQRMISRLIFLGDRFGKKQGNTITISMPLTHKDIAASINTSRETVNKILKALSAKKLVSYDRGVIRIHNISKLQVELSNNHSNSDKNH